MNQSVKQPLQPASPLATGDGKPRIAFIQSCWHRDIIDTGRDAFLAAMAEGGIAADQVDLFEVPGAFEIPLTAKLIGKAGRHAAIVAAGLVVDGGIYRHDFVASAVIDALMRLQLETEIPVISVVLTPQQFHEHATHKAFFREHFVVKGTEAAAACLATVEQIGRLKALAVAA